MKHNVQELQNSRVQGVIDTVIGEKTLTAAAAPDTMWYDIQRIAIGYPSKITLAIKVKSGTVAIRFVEMYDDTCYVAQHSDSSNILYTTSAPLSAGTWSVKCDPWGGQRIGIITDAVTDAVYTERVHFIRD